MEVMKMFKKIISSLMVGSVLLVGVGNTDTKDVKDVELQKAINYAPIIKEECKATNQYELTNVKNSDDVIESSKNLESGKTYKVSFKNDTAIEIKKLWQSKKRYIKVKTWKDETKNKR